VALASVLDEAADCSMMNDSSFVQKILPVQLPISKRVFYKFAALLTD
jgi:hypothetical protein